MIDLKEWMEYRDGKLFWIKPPRSGISVGDEVGTIRPSGHKRFYLQRKMYEVHRVIYWWHTGEWPEFVDHKKHIPGEVLDNSFDNLRPATRTQNNKNRSSAKGSSSKFLGVSWKNAVQKWKAHIRHEKKLYDLGTFTDEETAAKAYDEAAKKFHGEFANLNFKEE